MYGRFVVSPHFLLISFIWEGNLGWENRIYWSESGTQDPFTPVLENLDAVVGRLI